MYVLAHVHIQRQICVYTHTNMFVYTYVWDVAYELEGHFEQIIESDPKVNIW